MNKYNIIRSFSLFILMFLFSQFSFSQGLDFAKEKQAAMDVLQKIEDKANYIDKLNLNKLNSLPIGIKKTVANADFTLAVSKIQYLEGYAEVDLYARLKLPTKDKVLFFGAKGIKMSYDGDFIGDAKLTLLGDVEIPIINGTRFVLKGAFNNQTGQSGELTYVTVSCEGVKQFGITAEVSLPKSLVTKVVDGKATQDSVSATFSTVATDFNNIVATIDLPDFAIVGLNDFVFSCTQTVFDFSDAINSPTMTFPTGYKENYLLAGNEKLWRGFYAKEIKVLLPPQFKNSQSGSNTRVSLLANDMLIDENGITGNFIANLPILAYNEGSASGWKFSVDAFGFSLEANALTEAKFNGFIGVPVGEKSKLQYNALFDGSNYTLIVEPVDTLSFDVFKAKATILPESYVELKVIDGEFRPEAMLHGSLGIEMKDNAQSESKAAFKGVKFQSLHLQTQAPYIGVEYFGYQGDGSQFMNLPLSINEIGLRTFEGNVSLHFDFDLKLADAIQAGAALNINGEMSVQEGFQSLKYKSFDVERLSIDATLAGAIKLEGTLRILDNDPIYGNAVNGSIKMSFEKGLEGLSVQANAMFGKKGYHYWFVDAKVGLPPPGIQVGPLSLTGFSGGASHNMKKSGTIQTSLSASGCAYIPDDGYGLGLKAGVLFAIGQKSVVNGEASFEILFNKSGGINFLGFYGSAKFLGEIPGTENFAQYTSDALKKSVELENKFTPAQLLDKKLNSKQEAASSTYSSSLTNGQSGFSAEMAIEFDFVNHSFHASFTTYANFIGGVIRGVGENNKAGWAVIHIARDNFYIHVGTPTDPIGLKVGVGSFSLETRSYFMVGKSIPDAPLPPQQVADILGVELASLDYMRDLNSLEDGRGVAFGAQLKMQTGDMKFLILYANFEAGIGFDIMMRKYENAYCEGREGTIGFDGWYLNGQAYAYMQGEVGVNVNLKFIKKKISILKGGAAVLMQAQFPNPSWFQGYMAVNYSVLGGAVKGNSNFKITLGEQCQLVAAGSSPVDMEVIGDVSPSGETDVFSIPQAAFNVEIDKAFNAKTTDGKDSYLKVVLGSMTIKDDTGNNVPGEFKWNDDKNKLSFYSFETLKPNSTFTASVSVNFQEYVNGSWKLIYTGGVISEEKRNITFMTGEAPDNIPMKNVQHTYPVVDQKNFFPKETNTGFVKLNKGQSYLFTDSMTYTANFLTEDGNLITLPLTYDVANRQLNYRIPPALIKSKPYNLILAAQVKDAAGKSKTGATTYKEKGDAENSVSVREASADQLIREDIGKELLVVPFRTSAYGTFAERFDNIKYENSSYRQITSDIWTILSSVSSQESFDIVELEGNQYSNYKPLVCGLSMGQDDYYLKQIYPNIYLPYNTSGLLITNRDISDVEIPPLNGIKIFSVYLERINSSYANERFPYEYQLPYYYKLDYLELRNQIVNLYVTTKNDEMMKIMDYNYTSIPKGDYKVKFIYELPNGTVTSSVYYIFKKTF